MSTCPAKNRAAASDNRYILVEYVATEADAHLRAMALGYAILTVEIDLR